MFVFLLGLYFALSPFLSQITYASERVWGVPKVLDSTSVSSSDAKLVFDDLGNAFSIWVQNDGCIFNIYARRYSNYSWGEAILIDDNTLNSSYPQIVFDTLGNALAVWEQNNGVNRDIITKKYDISSGNWGDAENLSNNSSNNFDPQLAIDGSNNAIVVWIQEQEDFISYVKAKKYVSSSWESTSSTLNGIGADSSNTRPDPSIGMSSTGDAFVIWEQLGVDAIRSVYVSKYDGNTFGVAENIDNSDFDTYYPQVSFDNSGNAMAIWFQDKIAVGRNIVTNKYDGTNWGTPEIIDNDTVTSVGEPKIATDGTNFVAVWTNDSDLYFSKYDGTDWGTSSAVESSNEAVGANPQVIFDNIGNAFATWIQYDSSVSHDRAYVSKFSSDSWGTSQVVDGGVAESSYPQVAFDVSTGDTVVVWQQSDASNNIYANKYYLSVNPTISSNSATTNSITFSWGAVTGASTYYVQLNSETAIATTDTSYTFSSLTSGTTYTIGVKAVDSYVNSSSYATASVQTASAGGGSLPAPSSSGSGSNNTSADIGESKNAGPLTNDGTNLLVYIGSEINFDLGNSNSEHKATVKDLDTVSGKVTLELRSSPIIVSLLPKETKDIDLDGDKKNDVRIKYNELKVNRIDLTVTKLETPKGTVEENTVDAICKLVPGNAYKTASSVIVYYITEDCTKRSFPNEQTYFSYYNSWKDFQIIDKTILEAMNFDDKGPMGMGPKYSTLVKLADSGRVYVISNGNRYWFDSATVFDKLNYNWSWIGKVSEDFLNEYIDAGKWGTMDRHPNYTLIKYRNSASVYRIEPDPKDSSKQIKRLIPTEKDFLRLRLRFDRVVTISDLEQYPDGAELRN